MLDIEPFGPFFRVRLGPDFGPKSPNFNFLRKTGLFRTGLSPNSILTIIFTFIENIWNVEFEVSLLQPFQQLIV